MPSPVVRGWAATTALSLHSSSWVHGGEARESGLEEYGGGDWNHEKFSSRNE